MGLFVAISKSSGNAAVSVEPQAKPFIMIAILHCATQKDVLTKLTTERRAFLVCTSGANGREPVPSENQSGN